MACSSCPVCLVMRSTTCWLPPFLCCLLCVLLQPSKPDAAISLAQAFNLHSRPNATRKIMLDFDGSVTQNSAWNIRNGQATIRTPPYDKVFVCALAEPSPSTQPLSFICHAESYSSCAELCSSDGCLSALPWHSQLEQIIKMILLLASSAPAVLSCCCCASPPACQSSMLQHTGHQSEAASPSSMITAVVTRLHACAHSCPAGWQRQHLQCQ